MFQTKVVEKIKTHFLSSNFFFENCGVYEKMWKSIVEPGRPQTTHNCACALHAGYLRLQIHTLRLYSTHCFRTATMVARTRLGQFFVTRALSVL